MVALRSRHDRAIAALAVPSLGALLAEPLFVATDTALVGHLGPDALGGLGVAGTILQTAVGLLIFLAYATTPAVARRLGAGDRHGAARAGIDPDWKRSASCRPTRPRCTSAAWGWMPGLRTR